MGLNFTLVGHMMPYLVEKKQSGQTNMLELGDQVFRGWKNTKKTFMKGNIRYPLLTGKQLFSELGFYHISIDLKGTRGSKPCDLTRLLPRSLHNKFDIVTNSGTSEHVQDQYMVFKNMHMVAHCDAIFFHALPDPDRYPDHGLYYYTWEFMLKLAEICGYQVVRHGNVKKLIVTIVRKNNSDKFISRDAFNMLPIFRNKQDRTTGNNGYPRRAKKI
jgi:hypothetical protein